MIPIRLTLQGIYSYQETPQTIEFGPLLDAGLFGIFGSVGSGKSSILDAISMALYGEIERMGKRDDRNYNMMNLKSDRLYIDFEFSNYAGKRFRFECDGRRNSKQYDKVNTYNRKASEWKEDKWSPLSHANGEVVTGLSYDNFKRTLIIPQGRFQEFIGLTPGDRSQMLQDLFSLDKYDLTGATNQLTSQNSEEIFRIEGRLTGYEDVTPDMLKTYQKELEQLIESVDKQTEAFDRLKKEVETSLELKKLHSQYKERQVVFLKLKENEALIRSAEQQLKKYQEARQDFPALLNQIMGMRSSVLQLAKSLEDSTLKKGNLLASKEKVNETYESLKKATNQHDIRRKKADEADIAGRLRASLELLQGKEQRIEKGLKTVADSQNRIEETEKEIEQLEAKLTEERKSIQDRELLLQLKNAFDRKEELSSQIEKANERINNSRRILAERKVQFCKEYELDFSRIEEMDVATFFKSMITECTEKIEINRHNLHRLKVQEEMASYVEQLTSGESCPLCGSKEHPAPAHFEANSIRINEINTCISRLEDDRKRYEKGQLEWVNLVNEQKQITRDNAQEQEGISGLEESMRQMEILINEYVDQYPNKEQVSISWAATGRIMESIKDTENKLLEKRKTIRNEGGDLEVYRKKIEEFRSECDQLKGEVLSLKKNLSEDIENQLNFHTSEEWASMSRQLNHEIQLEKKEFGLITEKRDRILQEYSKLEANIKTTQDYLEKEKKELHDAGENLDSMLVGSSFESLDEVQALLKKEINIEKEEKRIRDHDQQIHVLERGMKDLESEMGNRKFDAEIHESLTLKFNETEKKLRELRDQKNYRVKKLEESRERWQEKKNLNEKLSRLQVRSGNLKILEGLFRGKKFVDYVSTIYLREICEIANRRFRKLTNNHFSLVLGDDNQFLVRDYLHDGQIRSVKTLSGGQTFQVSLSLALALAESLQNQNQSRQNFFFLDEGFGTLDGEALGPVMESLKSLRQEGRVVGVISHVESMQNEIDMYLHIVNDAEKGSHIKKSWTV